MDPVRVLLFSSTGQLLGQHTVHGQAQLDVGALPAGVYVIRPQGSAVARRFVKE